MTPDTTTAKDLVSEIATVRWSLEYARGLAKRTASTPPSRAHAISTARRRLIFCFILAGAGVVPGSSLAGLLLSSAGFEPAKAMPVLFGSVCYALALVPLAAVVTVGSYRAGVRAAADDQHDAATRNRTAIVIHEIRIRELEARLQQARSLEGGPQ